MHQGPEQRGHAARGLSDGLTQAIELVVVPVLFGLLGAFLDARLGIAPVLMLSLGFVGFGGACCSLYFRYQARMEALDDERTSRWRTPR